MRIVIGRFDLGKQLPFSRVTAEENLVNLRWLRRLVDVENDKNG